MNAETKHSGPVDVRAVLRAAAHTFKSRGELMPHDDLMQAEIAVAELIEAANYAYPPGDYSQDAHGYAVRSALDRVGGAK